MSAPRFTLTSVAVKLDSIAAKLDAVRADLKTWAEAAERRAAAQVEAKRAEPVVRTSEPIVARAPEAGPLEQAAVPRYFHPRGMTSHERHIQKKHEAAVKAHSDRILAEAKAKNEKAEARRAAYVQSVEEADRQSRKALACVNPRSGVGRAQHAEPDKDGRCFHCDTVIGPALPVGARAARQEARA